MLLKTELSSIHSLGPIFVCLQHNVRLPFLTFHKILYLLIFLVYNWCEVQTKMWVLNLGKPVNVPVLNEAMAIELGANLLGEGIIFVVAAGALIAEYNRYDFITITKFSNHED